MRKILLPSQLHMRMHPEMRGLLLQLAKRNYPDTLNDVINKILAKHLRRPDLAVPPKKRMGRPPKDLNGD